MTADALSLDGQVARRLARREGRFRLESGHHGDLWLDLEKLCLRPEPVRRLAPHRIEAICGSPGLS